MKGFFIVILLLLPLSNSFACLCLPDITTKDLYNSADIVANAIILESAKVDSIHANSDTNALLLYGQLYKGQQSTDTVNIRIYINSCSTSFSVGKNYIIFGDHENGNTYTTGMCSGNRLYSKKEHKVLSKLMRKNNR